MSKVIKKNKKKYNYIYFRVFTKLKLSLRINTSQLDTSLFSGSLQYYVGPISYIILKFSLKLRQSSTSL